MGRWKSTLLLTVVALVARTSSAQTVEQVINSFAQGPSLSRPTQLSISPSGSAVAAVDQHGNRIFVFATDGNLIWEVGETAPIAEPTAVCFDGEDAILFAIRAKLLIFRVAKAEPGKIDTMVDLSSILPKDASIDQILGSAGKQHLILDRHRVAIYQLESNWEKSKELISRGDRKGEIWSPTGMAVDLSGNIIVADEGSHPMQSFSPAGRFMYFGGWNAPQSERAWQAAAVTVTRDELIWVADITNSQWRVFDRTGNERNRYPFIPPLFHPNSAVTTPDNRLIISDERANIIIMRLP